MKHKGIIFFLVIMFLLAAGGAGTGYYYNSKRNETEKKPDNTEKTKVVYIYYLEDERVDVMPQNTVAKTDVEQTETDGEENQEAENTETENQDTTVEKKYKFLRFSCTNDLTGVFDEEKWEFVPAEEKDSTCSLYFVNTKYAVSFTVVNGTASENNPEFIEREESGQFVITPAEGYEYKDAVCSDDKEVIWNEKNNTLTVNAITKDVLCKVNFSVKTLTAKFTVINGTGNTSESTEYGGSVETVVEAKEGYEKPKIECTNKQTAIFENNKVSIQKLTNNTECKITFTAVPSEKYKLTLDLPSQVTVVSGTTSQEVESGKDATFTLRTEEEYVSNINCNDVTPSKVEEIDSYTKKYTFLSVKKDIKCTVTATRSEE